MPADVALLVNPRAGAGRAGAAGAVVARRLRQHGRTVEVLVGRDSADARERATAVVTAGARALVAVGGDGTVHVALQVVAGTPVPLGVVPAGTGNDFARLLGMPARDPAAAADVLAAAVPRRVDAGRVDGRWFAGVLASGFDSRVNDRANAMTWLRGRSRYPLAMAAELSRLRPIPYVLTLDGVEWRTDAMLVAVGNGTSYGGGMRVCPGALVDDGLLSVVVVGALGRAEFVRVFPRVYRGTHVAHPAVTERVARSVRLDAAGVTAYADGERLGPLPLRAEVGPGALTVLGAFVPPPPPGGGDVAWAP